VPAGRALKLVAQGKVHAVQRRALTIHADEDEA
jgi:hypothetical protein